MLNVDTNKISSEIKKLDKYISDYNNNSYDIYSELSKLSSYWNDGNQRLFEEKIVKQKESNIEILENLEKISNLYKEVESTYENK